SLGNTDSTVTIKDDDVALPANVSGALFIDYDADDVQDAAEAGVAGRIVFLDKNNDGVAGAGEPTATTGAGGAYSFTGLAPGSYSRRVRSRVLGWANAGRSFLKRCRDSLFDIGGVYEQESLFSSFRRKPLSRAVESGGRSLRRRRLDGLLGQRQLVANRCDP